jgi:hypothetical protein
MRGCEKNGVSLAKCPVQRRREATVRVETRHRMLDGSRFGRDGVAGVGGTRMTPCRGERRGRDGWGPMVPGMVGEGGTILVMHVVLYNTFCGHENNTLGLKKMCLIFLLCEVGPFNSVSPVLVTHIIQLRINPLINPPGRLLTVNV